jgi:hypothetical protein
LKCWNKTTAGKQADMARYIVVSYERSYLVSSFGLGSRETIKHYKAH